MLVNTISTHLSMHLPKSEYMADNTRRCVREEITTHCSPDSVVKNFQTSTWTWAASQSHWTYTSL